MTRFAASVIDLSSVPAPDALETLDYEGALSFAKAQFRAQWELERTRNPLLPAYDTLDLESDPVAKVLETFAYRELNMRARVNDAVRACMVAFAKGNDLVNLGLFSGVVKADGEDEESFRKRIVLAPEGYATAGPVGAYQFHALSADPVNIKDVQVLNPGPGKISVILQARAGNGVPSPDLLKLVLSALNKDEVIPHTDMLSVLPVKVRTYSIKAGLFLYPGPDAGPVLQAAIDAVTSYKDSVSRIGMDVTISGLYAALQRPGVQRVVIESPAGGLVIGDDEASFCTGIDVRILGRDE